MSYKKLVKFKHEMHAIKKNAKNPFFKSNYADLNQVMREIQDTLDNAGLNYTQTPQIDEHGAFLHTVLFDTDSGEVVLESKLKLMGDDMQKYGGAITYARRYSLICMLGLEVEDDDGNSATGKKPKPVVPDPAAANKIKNIGALIKNKAKNKQEAAQLFFKYTGVATAEEMYSMTFKQIEVIEIKVMKELGY